MPARLDRLPWTRFHRRVVIGLVALGFFISAAVMAIGGIAELVLGVKAEGAQLEDIAEPLTAEAEVPKDPTP